MEPKSTVFSIGVAQRTTNWHNWKRFWDKTTYDMNSNDHTILTGDLSIPKIATKIGVNVHQDSANLSRVQQIAGYLGIGAVNFRSEKGKFSGRAHFMGKVSSEQRADVTFDQKFFYSELDFYLGDVTANEKGKKENTYLGLRYTKWHLPSEIMLTQKSKLYLVIDEDYQAEFYSFILGVDDFANKLVYDSSHWTPGWDWMIAYTLGVGYGNCQVGAVAERAAQELHHITMTRKKYPVMAGHVSGLVGPMYGIQLGPLRAVLGIGYDLNFLFLGKSAFTEDSGLTEHPADNSGRADVDTYPMFFYHGVIFRLHGAF